MSVSNTSSQLVMASAALENTPKDRDVSVLARILSYLDGSDVTAYLTVCRIWRQALETPQFLNLYVKHREPMERKSWGKVEDLYACALLQAADQKSAFLFRKLLNNTGTRGPLTFEPKWVRNNSGVFKKDDLTTFALREMLEGMIINPSPSNIEMGCLFLQKVNIGGLCDQLDWAITKEIKFVKAILENSYYMQHFMVGFYDMHAKDAFKHKKFEALNLLLSMKGDQISQDCKNIVRPSRQDSIWVSLNASLVGIVGM